MGNVLIHTYRIPVEKVKKKIVYHFSDLHLTQYDVMSSKSEVEEAQTKTADWEVVRKYFADKYAEEYGEIQAKSAKTHFENLIEASKDADVLLLSGDIMDYLNGANIRCIEEMLGKIYVPFMYVPGNHEPVNELIDSEIFHAVKQSIQKIEFDDFVILGIDNSRRKISVEQNDFIENNLKREKPAIILMHIPVMTPENEELLKECGEYFYINYDGAPKENFRFIDIIKENAENVIAVMAGHLHFANVSKITSKVTQYVSSQAITGNINRYIIGC